MADENTSSAAVGTTAYDTQQQLEVVTNIKSSRTINTSDSITNHHNNTNHNNTNNNNTSAGSDVNVSSKKRKADRWKQVNLSKKEKSRISAEMNNRRRDKQQVYNDDGNNKVGNTSVALTTPHEGSYAHEKMRQLFNVNIEDDMLHFNAKDGNVGSSTATATAAEDEEGDIKNHNTDIIPKLPKRKLAILVSFLGTDYYGFQINPNHRTLQSEIELALYKAGIISHHNFGYPNKYSWSNSARTDKGVHAAAQVCSFKGEMIFHNGGSTTTSKKDGGGENGNTVDDGGKTATGGNKNKNDDDESYNLKMELEAMRNKVNEYLPSEIRILDMVRPTSMFCARTNRNKVRYQYMVPSYMFCSREEVQSAFMLSEDKEQEKKQEDGTSDETTTPTIRPEILAQARNRLMNYRVTPEQLDRLQHGLKLFEGTHCFHNYTRRVGANDASSSRYILSFVPLDPILVPSSHGYDTTTTKEDEGFTETTTKTTQWIPLQVVGQSFLLNQIRKMVSAAVDYARGAVTEEDIQKSLTKECKMKVNVAPAQGLFLDRSYYDIYNRQKGKNAPKTKKHSTTTTTTNTTNVQQQQHDNTLDWAEAEGQEELPPAGKLTT
jgi:tRNA pseudouridine38-40 synthase